jgi:hypothetical protein
MCSVDFSALIYSFKTIVVEYYVDGVESFPKYLLALKLWGPLYAPTISKDIRNAKYRLKLRWLSGNMLSAQITAFTIFFE